MKVKQMMMNKGNNENWMESSFHPVLNLNIWHVLKMLMPASFTLTRLVSKSMFQDLLPDIDIAIDDVVDVRIFEHPVAFVV